MCRDEKFFVGDVDEEYICSIGQGVLVDPVMAPCQHEFCEQCIMECLKHKKVCSVIRPLIRCFVTPSSEGGNLNSWRTGPELGKMGLSVVEPVPKKN